VFNRACAQCHGGTQHPSTTTPESAIVRPIVRYHHIQTPARTLPQMASCRVQPGRLVVVQGDALVAQPFDLETFELRGDAFPIAERIAPVRSPEPGVAYSVSSNGVLAWEPAASHIVQLTWFNRSGRKLSTLGGPAPYWSPALALDETRLAVSRRDEQTGTRDLWIFNLVNGAHRRLTFDPADENNPTWSPDGSRIAFSSNRTGTHEIYQKLANGSGGDEFLLASVNGPHYVGERAACAMSGHALQPAAIHTATTRI
jgi:hypothetical protein